MPIKRQDPMDEDECCVEPTPPKRRRYREMSERHFVEPSGAIRAEGMRNRHIKQLLLEANHIRRTMSMKDHYTMGYHNGLQRALSLLTGRRANYIFRPDDLPKLTKRGD